jgi:hypothetical protein
MTELNNRQLATKIHQACKEHGLKQTVILDVLVKHKGMRSIQCADKSNSEYSGKIKLEEKNALMHHLRTELYCHYPDNDLLNIVLDEVIDEPKVRTDDALFDFFFNKAYDDIFDVIPALERAYSLLEDMEVFIARSGKAVDVSENGIIANSPLSKSNDVDLLAFIISELHDCSEGEIDPVGAQCTAMENAYHDVETVMEGLNIPFYEKRLSILKEG